MNAINKSLARGVVEKLQKGFDTWDNVCVEIDDFDLMVSLRTRSFEGLLPFPLLTAMEKSTGRSISSGADLGNLIMAVSIVLNRLDPLHTKVN